MKKLLLCVLAMSISLVSAEVLLRLFAPLHFTGFTDAYQYDSELGYRAAPGHHLATTDYQQELFVNDFGTVNFQDSFDDYEHLIFAVGDSFTQGTGLPADASYPFQLDLMLNTSTGSYHKTYGVVNLGLAAYGSEQTLLALKRYIALLGAPKFILYTGCENDAVDDALFASGVRHKNIVQGNPSYGIFYHPLNFVLYKSEVGKRIRFVLQESVIRKSATKSVDSSVSVAEQSADTLEKIRTLAREIGATLIVTWSEGGYSYEWLQYWADSREVAFADWQPSMTTISQAIPHLPQKNSHSGGHYRTWVNTVIASAFCDLIKGQSSRTSSTSLDYLPSYTPIPSSHRLLAPYSR